MKSNSYITLKRITSKNWRDVITLKVAPGQKQFVASNVWSLAQAKFYPAYKPYGIYLGKTPIGFIIDKKYQRQGYGLQAKLALLDLLKKKNIEKIYTTYTEHNSKMKDGNIRLGFVETGEVIEGDEHVMVKQLSNT